MKEPIGNISTDQRKFTMVYHDFLDSNILDGKEKIIYILLKRYLTLGSDEGQVFPKIQTLMEQSGMAKGTVTNIIKSLKKKGILQVKRRGLNKSNIYTLFDYADIWKCESKEEITRVIEDYEVAKATELLQKNGYEVIKKESIADNTDQSINLQSTQTNSSLISFNNTVNELKSQDGERYSLDQVKQLFDYKIMINDYPLQKQDIDSVINILHTNLNTTKKTIRVGGEEIPSGVVQSKLKKLSYSGIMYVIEKFKMQTVRIKNPTSYMLRMLYEADEQMHWDVTNQVQHDMHNWKPSKTDE